MSESRIETVKLAKDFMWSHCRSLDNPGRVEILANYIDNYIDLREKNEEIHKDNGIVPNDVFMSKRLQVATQLMGSLMTTIQKEQLWQSSEFIHVALVCADKLIETEAKRLK